MKVGDLVKINEWTLGSYSSEDLGLVLNVEYIKHGQYLVTCLWNDGTVEALAKSDLEVVNETHGKKKINKDIAQPAYPGNRYLGKNFTVV